MYTIYVMITVYGGAGAFSLPEKFETLEQCRSEGPALVRKSQDVRANANVSLLGATRVEWFCQAPPAPLPPAPIIHREDLE